MTSIDKKIKALEEKVKLDKEKGDFTLKEIKNPNEPKIKVKRKGKNKRGTKQKKKQK